MITRRSFIAKGSAVGLLAATGTVFAQQVAVEVSDLLPGQYTWHPDRQPDGPVAIIVSIPQQLVHVYRNGVRIAVSTCSTGKPGHSTPTGVFADHRSSTYNNAPMPNMNRLTWSGIALHAGNLPGYPASHGCVRLPLEFSAKLFGITHIGTPVIIAGSNTDPWDLTHPGMVLGDYAEHEFEDVVASLDGKSHPSDWADDETKPVTTMIASSADQKVLLIEDDVLIAESKLTVNGPAILGEHVLMLKGVHDGKKGLIWHGISHHEDPAYPHRPEEAVAHRLIAEKSFVQIMKQHVHPGMVMIVTDVPLHPDRRTGSDFVIMDSIV